MIATSLIVVVIEVTYYKFYDLYNDDERAIREEAK